MGSRAGRPAVPTAIRQVNGNPGKRPFNQEEPEPEIPEDVPPPPAWLEGEAKIRWEAIAGDLHGLGLLTTIDMDALAAYCQVWGRWKEAEQAIKQFGQVVKTPKGYPVQSPYISIANKALSHVRAFESEFGMTPSSRSRVHVKKKDPKNQARRFMASTPKLRVV